MIESLNIYSNRPRKSGLLATSEKMEELWARLVRRVCIKILSRFTRGCRGHPYRSVRLDTWASQSTLRMEHEWYMTILRNGPASRDKWYVGVVEKFLFFIFGLCYTLSATQSNIVTSFKGIHFGKKCILSLLIPLNGARLCGSNEGYIFSGVSLVGVTPFFIFA